MQDYLYVRLLDIPAAFSARRYPVVDELVVDVVDELRPATAGRYVIAGGPDRCHLLATDAAADLRMDVADLGSLLLGGVAARDLGRTGRIAEPPSGPSPAPTPSSPGRRPRSASPGSDPEPAGDVERIGPIGRPQGERWPRSMAVGRRKCR